MLLLLTWLGYLLVVNVFFLLSLALAVSAMAIDYWGNNGKKEFGNLRRYFSGVILQKT
jgi:hypothetical protein